ncbi:hypothetical protein B0H19DRAFT_1249675 [Mycena capillaripes]|nr:hypothetical protein B0H19DRAFT_1249675 [Mycena capillaripes]
MFILPFILPPVNDFLTDEVPIVGVPSAFSPDQPEWMIRDPASFPSLPSPSTAAKNEQMKNSQRVEVPLAVYNGRPEALTGPPLCVYHPVFAEFLEEYLQPDPPAPSDADIAAAHNFCAAAAGYFNDELKRQEALMGPHAHFFGTNSPGVSHKLYRNGTQHCITDGIFMADLTNFFDKLPAVVAKKISAYIRESKCGVAPQKWVLLQ